MATGLAAEPALRASEVTLAAAMRSWGVTKAMVYAWRVGTSHLRQRVPDEQNAGSERKGRHDRDQGKQQIRREMCEHHGVQQPVATGQRSCRQKRESGHRVGGEEERAERTERHAKSKMQAQGGEALYDQASGQGIDAEEGRQAKNMPRDAPIEGVSRAGNRPRTRAPLPRALARGGASAAGDSRIANRCTDLLCLRCRVGQEHLVRIEFVVGFHEPEPGADESSL